MPRYIGQLDVVNRPSDSPPSGSRGRSIILTTGASQKLTEEVVGQPLLDGHFGQPIGAVESAILENGLINLCCSGVQNLHDLPLSYEIKGARVVDTRPDVWTVRDFDSCSGIAVLPKNTKPAYNNCYLKEITDANR